MAGTTTTKIIKGIIKNNKSNNGIVWENKGLNEVGRRADNNEIVIRIDSRYFRPTEVDELLGDASKARKKLGWSPSISLEAVSYTHLTLPTKA